MAKFSNFLAVTILSILKIKIINAQTDCPSLSARIDCLLNASPTETDCTTKGCIWCPAPVEVPTGAPSCVLPQNYGYEVTNIDNSNPNVLSISLKRATAISYFGNDSEVLTVEFFSQSNYRLRIKVTDDKPRYEVPLVVDPPKDPSIEDKLYEVQTSGVNELFWFKILRKNSGTVLFDTSLGGFTFSDQFLQFSTILPTKNSYGFGENEQRTFRHDFENYTTFPMFARSQSPEGYKNLYGVQPYYTVVEPDGQIHSVMIVNSNAQEVVLTPAPGFIYRTIGGILDLYIFLGPSPEQTSQQFTEAVGRQSLPPYWGLGFQLSRWGYGKLEAMKNVVQEMKDAGIPQDVQYGDIDIMNSSLDFTYDTVNFAGLPEYVDQLKQGGVKFVTILDPGISFDQPFEYRPFDYGNELDVWMKRPSDAPMVGSVWPGLVHFPDFSKSNTTTWWVTLIKEFYDNVLKFDGLWIDMNEPASWADGDIEEPGCDVNNSLNYPPYVPGIAGDKLFNKTACPDHIQEFGLHYNTHSLYGWSQSEPTLVGVRVATGKRSLVLSRSTFLGSGKWAAHWLGDNYSWWSNLHYSIIGMLQFNHFGIPYVGADICGFFEDATEELCTRWQQLGAFYPFSRNHNINSTIDQHPSVWSQTSISSTKKALEIRYTLLPYLYTLFYFHKTRGNTVIRALWHEFPTDATALGIDRQFLWGSGVMICPVLEQGVKSIPAYFPDARWYYYDNGFENPVLILNTQETRINPFGLIVAQDDNNKAYGHLYFDDGDSIDPQDTGSYFLSSYQCSENRIRNDILSNGYAEMQQRVLDTVRILGITKEVNSMKFNSVNWTSFTQNRTTGEVYIRGLQFPMTRLFSIDYTLKEWNDATTTTTSTTTPGDKGAGYQSTGQLTLIAMLSLLLLTRYFGA